ncbi:hypothetical protein EAF00_001145 [Botryotinia globosa]|nr:hypothetical protein EAF00_001145 [Botryotinia globosa]
MPAITRSKSPSKKAPADQNRASSAADTSPDVAPVANKKAPAKEALAGAKKALSDAMVPALAPLSPSKRKRSSKILSGDEGVGAKPSEPLKRTRVEQSNASGSHPTSGQPDLAATTYPQVERVILGLEVTPVFGATGGAPKEGLDAAASTPTSSPKSVETTAAAPVLDGEENGAMAKAPISATTDAAGQVDDESVLEQHSPHPAADPADPLTANEAEAHVPAATQGCSASDLEVAKEELGSPKIGYNCDELAAKNEEIAQLKADLRQTQATLRQTHAALRQTQAALRESQADVDRVKAVFQKQYKAVVEETNDIELKGERAQKENVRLRKDLDNAFRLNNELRTDKNRFSYLCSGLKKENDQLDQKNGKLIQDINKYNTALNVFNKHAPLLTSDQEELQQTKKLLEAATVKVAEYEGEHQNAERYFAARKVAQSVKPVNPAQGGMSHDYHSREGRAQENRSRDFRTPSPDNNGRMKGAQQPHSASGLVGFREPPRWECRHDRGYNGNTCAHCGVHVLAEGHPEFDRDRSVTPSVGSQFDFSDIEEHNNDSASHEPAEAAINTQDGFENYEDDEEDGSLYGVSPAVSGNRGEENDEEDGSQHGASPVVSGNRGEENDEEDGSQHGASPVVSGNRGEENDEEDGSQHGASPVVSGNRGEENDEEDGSQHGASPVVSDNRGEENDEEDGSQYGGSSVVSGNRGEENDEEDGSQYGRSPVVFGNRGEENSNEDGPQYGRSPVLQDYEFYEIQDQQDHQEPPHPAAEVEKTTAAPSDLLTSSSPSPSSSRKRKESPVSASSPAKKFKLTETDLAGPSSTAAPDKASFFKPAHPGWGSPSVLSPQVAVTAPAPSTPSSASERNTAAPLFPTVITRSGAAVQFGAATTFGAFGAARSSVRFGTTSSFGVPAFAASPKVDDAEDKPADEKK